MPLAECPSARLGSFRLYPIAGPVESDADRCAAQQGEYRRPELAVQIDDEVVPTPSDR
jgi:hypothetical protein